MQTRCYSHFEDRTRLYHESLTLHETFGTQSLHEIRKAWAHPRLCPEKPPVVCMPRAVASPPGDHGAVSLTFSDIITRNLVYSGQQTSDASGATAASLAEAVTGRLLEGASG